MFYAKVTGWLTSFIIQALANIFGRAIYDILNEIFNKNLLVIECAVDEYCENLVRQLEEMADKVLSDRERKAAKSLVKQAVLSTNKMEEE